MKFKDAIKTLQSQFMSYSFHTSFIKELGELLRKDLRGKEDAFFNCLTTQLNYIKNLGVLVYMADDHEIIHGFDGHFYSIHLKQKQFNVRFLVHIDALGTPIFLCAFYERSGHRKGNYDEYTSVLQERFDSMIKGDNADE